MNHHGQGNEAHIINSIRTSTTLPERESRLIQFLFNVKLYEKFSFIAFRLCCLLCKSIFYRSLFSLSPRNFLIKIEFSSYYCMGKFECQFRCAKKDNKNQHRLILNMETFFHINTRYSPFSIYRQQV